MAWRRRLGGDQKKDFCCRRSCERLGGPRSCPEAVSYYKNDEALAWGKMKDA